MQYMWAVVQVSLTSSHQHEVPNIEIYNDERAALEAYYQERATLQSDECHLYHESRSDYKYCFESNEMKRPRGVLFKRCLVKIISSPDTVKSKTGGVSREPETG
ncbi:MAG: hypothetical protein ACYCOU_03095 [Sulfobacillus sp.]